jgi:superfamily I DNA and/or RNA helicase
VSLFERLLNNNSKKVMLNIQHRMRPEISILMRNFYDNPVQDHASVMFYPNVNGLKKNIYFIDHNNLERVANDSQSKSNLFEVDFIINLCLYLLKQNYQQTQITILTMYLGQMSELNKLLRFNQLTNIKCTTVDNYQGKY